MPISILAIMFDRSTEYKNLIMCVVSALFIVWGKAAAALLIFACPVVDYFLGIAAEGSAERDKKSSAVFMIADLVWNVFIFVYLQKNSLFPVSSPMHLRAAVIPVGAAFFTLKNFSYVYDVYSGKIKAERNFFCLLTYSVSYPFLLAGPVVRYGDIKDKIHNRTVDVHRLSDGLTRFAVGLAKTALVVPVLARLSDKGLSVSEPTVIGAWLGMIAFFGEAYFTFMGLSDMGVGIAKMNGFDVEVNYGSISSKHMLGGLIKSYNTSMITFFEDIRGTKASAVFFTLLLAIAGTFFYADSKYIMLFGIIIALLLAIEWLIGYEAIEKIPAMIKLPVLFILSMLIFSSFAFDSMGAWKNWLFHLMGKNVLYILSKPVKYTVINNCWLLLIALISVSPIGRAAVAAFEKSGGRSAAAYGRMRVIKTALTALLLIASYITLAANV